MKIPLDVGMIAIPLLIYFIIMGHQDIEMTGRYARLTDRTREKENFRAMAVIEKSLPSQITIQFIFCVIS